jgi:hypothetical protein
VRLSQCGTSVTNEPVLPATFMIHGYGAFGRMRIRKETEVHVFGGNLFQGHFVHHKSHMV